MKIKQLYIGHYLTLLVGSFIYIFFRTSNLRMFDWFERLNVLSSIISIRKYTCDYKSVLPDFILYALPDGLWMFSYINLVLYLWKNELRYQNLFWFLIIPALAIGSEIGQILKLIPGTFDVADLLIYMLGTILPFIIYKKSITINLITV